MNGMGRLLQFAILALTFAALAIGEQASAGSGEDAEVGCAVVIEVAGGDEDDVLEVVEAAVVDPLSAGLVEACAGGGPGDQVGAAVVIEIDEGEAGMTGAVVADEVAGLKRDGRRRA